MKDFKEITAVISDYGTFQSLAVRLAKDYKKVYYHTPIDDEYRNVKDCVIGDGLEGVERLDELVTPDTMKEIDLWIFPDIGWGGLQKYLRSIGKAVWGSMGADEYELYRTRFLSLLKKIGLPVIHSEKVVGLTNLIEYLKDKKNKWVKINRYRENMETWHHLDYEHSQRMFEYLALEFGGVKDFVTFVVQDHIESTQELGYDGWNISGQYPESSYQGYEKKNELYLGTELSYKDTPDEIKVVCKAFAPLFEEIGYRNFASFEVIVKDKISYCIDPTFRLPGQTGEQLLETCSNLAEVIWRGANGELIKPKFDFKFAVEATIHYTENSDIWKTIRVPKEVERWVKLYHYCIVDGAYQFPESKNDELGVLLGVGNSIEGAIERLKKNLELLKDEPICCHLQGMTDLLEEAKAAKEQGIKFAEKVPSPTIMLK